ncbi:hypothetical protein [Limnoraphis robusta]|uniref:hypothetical protein n=1 Tax=Limnoraphis robusta TaxID=1118279 RepID=UPI001364C25C|nr:hypothetical protein [Limnoraphis robusta]
MTSANYLALPKVYIEGQSPEKMKLVLEDVVQIIVESLDNRKKDKNNRKGRL